MAIIDALLETCLEQWRHHLKTCNNISKDSTFSSNPQLHLNGHNVNLDNVISKSIYNEARPKNDSVPTAQSRYTETYSETLEWGKIYQIPFKVAIDCRFREFQYKILHRYLGTNRFLYKIGLVPSSMCTALQKRKWVYRTSTVKMWIFCRFLERTN